MLQDRAYSVDIIYYLFYEAKKAQMNQEIHNIIFAIYLPLLQIVNFCGGVSMSAIWASATSQGGFFNFTAWAGFLISIGAFLLHALQIHQSVIIDL